MLLPAERQGHPAPAAIAEMRAAMKAGVAGGAWKTRTSPLVTELAGRRVLRFAPAGACRGLLLHLHGGGFRLGLPEMTGPYAEALAARCGAEVVLPEYRLAPEHPFPAGLNDAMACLHAFAEEARARGLPLVVAGDSAGGGLAASICLLAGMEGMALAGLVLLSPWLDLTVSAPSYVGNKASDPLFSLESATLAAKLYLQGADASHPLASPVFAEIPAYPRTLITVGSGEVLVDDCTAFHARLRSAGVDAALLVVDGMEHTAPARNFALTGARESFEHISRFVQQSFD
jgi:monoterpene epsilon-lactone hydrolase